jgi:hypothetical protein
MDWGRCVHGPHPAPSPLLLLLLLQLPLHLQQHPADVNAQELLHSGGGTSLRVLAAL